MPPPDLSRVVVVGTSCAGKTTFARRLAGIVGAAHVELDALHWGPQWTPRPDFQRDVSAAVQQQHWVIDGNYSVVRDLVWRRCTTIVWLDYAFTRVFFRALRRTAGRVITGERLYAGDRETVRDALLYAETEQRWYEIKAVFFRGDFEGQASGVGSEELYWLDPKRELDAFFHACHAWAVAQAL